MLSVLRSLLLKCLGFPEKKKCIQLSTWKIPSWLPGFWGSKVKGEGRSNFTSICSFYLILGFWYSASPSSCVVAPSPETLLFPFSENELPGFSGMGERHLFCYAKWESRGNFFQPVLLFLAPPSPPFCKVPVPPVPHLFKVPVMQIRSLLIFSLSWLRVVFLGLLNQ